MREIKFRGKQEYDGKWIYGFYTKSALGIERIRHQTKDCTWIDERIIPDTVGQLTGLKDKNGKEIYEGDIVASKCGNEVYFGDVQFDFGTFGVELADNKKGRGVRGVWGQKHNLIRMDDGIADMLEVVGNIHDNPDLLKLQEVAQ
jgi:uncharacterized phage protein (TIGR01671 family)